MFEFLLVLVVISIVTVLILEFKQTSKKIASQLREAERVTDRTRVMCVSGEQLNKKRELQLEMHDAHVAEIEKEHNFLVSRRKDIEAVLNKQTKSRKKVRGKRRKGR